MMGHISVKNLNKQFVNRRRSRREDDTAPFGQAVEVLENVNDPGRLADLVASNLRLTIEESQAVLEIFDPLARLRRVNDLLKHRQADGVAHFQAVPGRERQGLAVTLHERNGLGRTLLRQIERHDEAGIREGFQMVPLFRSRTAFMVLSAMVLVPNTFFSRAAMCGIGRRSGAMSRDTMLDLSRRGDVLPDGRSSEEEAALINKETSRVAQEPCSPR